MSSHTHHQHVRPPAPRHGPPHENLDFPDLRLLPSDALVLHEFADHKRVARLERRIRAEGYLKNPPIVAPIPGSDRYVVLDGANRTSAIKRIGCPHVLVQIVDYRPPRVQLVTWHHLITGRDRDTFLGEIASVPGLTLQEANIEAARQALKQKLILAYIVLPGERSTVVAVDGLPGTDHHGTTTSTALLNEMVSTYKSDPQVSIHRVNNDELDDLVYYYDDISGLVVFQPYAPEDIIKLAETGMVVPSGITRHIISHRALRVNVPLTLLCGEETLEEKNEWWHEQVKSRLAGNEIRLYQESTYLFDE
jgi:hypothetical protein